MCLLLLQLDFRHLDCGSKGIRSSDFEVRFHDPLPAGLPEGIDHPLFRNTHAEMIVGLAELLCSGPGADQVAIERNR